ncbi:hypothetical protein EV360DRAFT_87930 [Lentinula raphanica]|nr:hypothetical protein EV360DRAFT_87930 [Lentinula raphanica]
MAKRPKLVLRALYAFRRARATSSADGQGYLYAYVDHGRRWKVGMARDFERRRKEWDQQCPCEDRIRMNPIATTRRRRAESLAHLSLELECSDRPKDYCGHCRRKHVEIFLFSDDWVYDWMNIAHDARTVFVPSPKQYNAGVLLPDVALFLTQSVRIAFSFLRSDSSDGRTDTSGSATKHHSND